MLDLSTVQFVLPEIWCSLQNLSNIRHLSSRVRWRQMWHAMVMVVRLNPPCPLRRIYFKCRKRSKQMKPQYDRNRTKIPFSDESCRISEISSQKYLAKVWNTEGKWFPSETAAAAGKIPVATAAARAVDRLWNRSWVRTKPWNLGQICSMPTSRALLLIFVDCKSIHLIQNQHSVKSSTSKFGLNSTAWFVRARARPFYLQGYT